METIYPETLAERLDSIRGMMERAIWEHACARYWAAWDLLERVKEDVAHTQARVDLYQPSLVLAAQEPLPFPPSFPSTNGGADTHVSG